MTRLTVSHDLALVGPAEQQAGCLARLMPQLQGLFLHRSTRTAAGSLAAAIAGHPSLDSLQLHEEWDRPSRVDQLRLSSCCPQLTSLDLKVGRGCSADALLAELGQCCRLRALNLLFLEPQDGPAACKVSHRGVAALAASPAGRALQSVVINTKYPLGLDAAVPLLAGPGCAQSVKMCVSLEGEHAALMERHDMPDDDAAGQVADQLLERARGLLVDTAKVTDISGDVWVEVMLGAAQLVCRILRQCHMYSEGV